MSKYLSQLLDEPEILVESAIKKLEHISGWESTDIRLLAEINNKVRAKITELGLDPDDTTGPELYHALLARIDADEHNFNMPYIKMPTNKLIDKIDQVHKSYKVYALKQNVAKDILRAHPPRRLMKQLGYRSADSLIKRENINALYAVLESIESSRWLNVYWKDLAKLSPSDFETRNVSVVVMEDKYAVGSVEPVSNVPLLGAVAVWDSYSSKVGLVADITRSISELRTVCALVKLRNVEYGFGANLVEILKGETKNPLQISHLPISWRTIFHHYGQRSSSEHTEFFGPHVLHDDIKVHEITKTMAKAFPDLKWWQDLEFTAHKTEQGIVSFNLMDILSSRGNEFKDRSLSHYRKSLWHEFVGRYFAHPTVEQHFMQKLEPQTVPVVDTPQSSNPEFEIRQMMELGV
jgi:hypothetical protein